MRRRLFFAAALLIAAAGRILVSCSSDANQFSTDGEQQFAVDAGSDASEVDGTSPKGCSASSTTIERIPVVMEFLVDESTSMNADGRWRAAREALLATLADMKSTAEPATFIGVLLYPKNDSVTPKSLLDDAHYEELIRAVDVGYPSGAGTPTAYFLKVAYDIVERFEAPANAGLVMDETKRIVILVSDGVPSDGRDKCEQLVEESFAKAPPGGPIRTFSVGIGPFPKKDTSYDPVFMGEVARKGGTAPAGCDPLSADPSRTCHYQITPGTDVEQMRQSLVDAIDEIRALAASCELDSRRTSTRTSGTSRSP